MHPDAHELARRFNEDEEVWHRYQEKRLRRLLSGFRSPFSEEFLDDLDWREAEAEVGQTRCIGKELP
jgi:hypothetical protein